MEEQAGWGLTPQDVRGWLVTVIESIEAIWAWASEASLTYERLWLDADPVVSTAPSDGRIRNSIQCISTANGIDPFYAGVDIVAAWIGDMLSRANPRGAVPVHLDGGAGLANATAQQRIVAVRSFYEFLVEDGPRERNPVRRGQWSKLFTGLAGRSSAQSGTA